MAASSSLRLLTMRIAGNPSSSCGSPALRRIQNVFSPVAPAPLISQEFDDTNPIWFGGNPPGAHQAGRQTRGSGLKTLTSLALTISSMSAPMPALVTAACSISGAPFDRIAIGSPRALSASSPGRTVPETQPGAGTHPSSSAGSRV